VCSNPGPSPSPSPSRSPSPSPNPNPSTNPNPNPNQVHRVLRPGGCVVVAFSNRCFESKAVALWMRKVADPNPNPNLNPNLNPHPNPDPEPKPKLTQTQTQTFTLTLTLTQTKVADGAALAEVVCNYIHFGAPEGWAHISCADISPSPDSGDPLWLVVATKM